MESMCKSIFQKEINDLALNDLVNFFSLEQEETSVLEFKSGEVSLESIYREVSAFMNTEGGLLIIGAPKEFKSNTGQRVCKGELEPSLKIVDKDRLIMSIASNITPAPYKLKAKELLCGEGKVFVLEIPQSFTPPHQVSAEGKYYIRLEREAKAAPHGIIEALFFRRQKPNLNVQISMTTKGEVESLALLRTVEFTLYNDSSETAESIGIIIYIDGVKEVIKLHNIYNKENEDLKNDAGLLSLQQNFGSTILVKGISTTMGLDLLFKSRYTIIECEYWCKSVQMESKALVYDFEVDDFIKEYTSHRNDNDISQKELYEFYKELKQTII